MTFMAVPTVFQPRIWTMNRPLTRPPATLSPSEGERAGVRGRFIGRAVQPSVDLEPIEHFARAAGGGGHAERGVGDECLKGSRTVRRPGSGNTARLQQLE